MTKVLRYGTLRIFGQRDLSFEICITRKCPLRGHCLAPPGRRQRITLKREKIFGAGGITDNVTDNVITEGRTDVEFEIVF